MIRYPWLKAHLGFVLCALALYGLSNSACLRVEADEVLRKRKEAEIRASVKRLSNAKGKAIEDLKIEFKKLEEEGIPVARILCDAIVKDNPRSVEPALLVLESLSASTAQDARLLVSISPSNAPNPLQLFSRYDEAFKKLANSTELDPALSPLVAGVILKLCRLGSTNSSVIPGDSRYDTYESGMKVLANLAKKDDAAFQDLLKILALNARAGDEEFNVRGKAIRSIGRVVGDDAERAKKALPILMSALKTALNPPRDPLASVGVNALSSSIYSFAAFEILEAIEQMGQNAASVVPQIRQLKNHPVHGKAATRVLSKIGVR